MIANARRWRPVWYGVAAVTLATAAWVLVSRPPAKGEQTEANWRAVVPSPVENHITLLAHVQAAQQYLINAPFESDISQLNVQEGQQVHKGDALLTLDITPLQLAYRDAQAQFLKTRQSLRNLRYWENSNEVLSARRALLMAEMSERDASSQLGAAEPLYHQGIIARSERDSLLQQLASRRLDLQAARQALTAAQVPGNEENQAMAELELNNAEQKLQQIRDQQARSGVYAPVTAMRCAYKTTIKRRSPFPG
ncbi:Multidrug resistance protein MdtA [Dickeya solani]|nr:Multidrug resistance protein MdtA [Dickeya solani]